MGCVDHDSKPVSYCSCASCTLLGYSAGLSAGRLPISLNLYGAVPRSALGIARSPRTLSAIKVQGASRVPGQLGRGVVACRRLDIHRLSLGPTIFPQVCKLPADS